MSPGPDTTRQAPGLDKIGGDRNKGIIDTMDDIELSNGKKKQGKCVIYRPVRYPIADAA